MRITSGQFKNRPLVSPLRSTTHPMSERARLALFNVLGPEITLNATVLDLFAGTGALGLEALSRGASHCTFVENSRPALLALRQNITSLNLTQKTTIFASSYQNFTPSHSFDLIFIDPPYQLFHQKPQSAPILLDYITHYLKSQGIVVLSHPKDFITPVPSSLVLTQSKTFAAANLSFFRYRLGDSHESANQPKRHQS